MEYGFVFAKYLGDFPAGNCCVNFSSFRVVQSQIKPTLDKLNSDTDVDVKYFTSEAIASIAG